MDYMQTLAELSFKEGAKRFDNTANKRVLRKLIRDALKLSYSLAPDDGPASLEEDLADIPKTLVP